MTAVARNLLVVLSFLTNLTLLYNNAFLEREGPEVSDVINKLSWKLPLRYVDALGNLFLS